jgi:hypothetical protein
MKKTILLAVCALFIGATAFAQSEEKKPTKEATIEWLKPKLMEYAFANNWYPNDMEITITPCEIVISGTQKDDTFVSECHYATNYTKIKNGYISYDYNGYRVIEQKNKRVIAEKKEWNFLLSEKTPPEMAKRIESAIRHLATFCSKYQKSEDEPF